MAVHQGKELKQKFNWFYIFQQGYAVIALPLNLFSFATTTYYLMVNNVSFLKGIFPQFWGFLIFAFLFGVPSVFIIGILYIRSELYRGSAKVNPYSYLLIGNQIPLYEAIAIDIENKGERGKVVAEQLRKIIEESGGNIYG
jgi:hypothetical protein